MSSLRGRICFLGLFLNGSFFAFLIACLYCCICIHLPDMMATRVNVAASELASPSILPSPSREDRHFLSRYPLHSSVTNRYGAQLDQALDYRDVVIGPYNAQDPFRLWQLNRFVTGGVNAGYDDSAMEEHMLAKVISSAKEDETLAAPGPVSSCHF